jgi:acyl-CoA dehydrogenase
MYVSHKPDDATGRLEVALVAAIARERIEEKVRAARGAKALRESDPQKWAAEKIITQEEANALGWARKLIAEAIAVDDFAAGELARAKEPAREESKRTAGPAAA